MDLMAIPALPVLLPAIAAAGVAGLVRGAMGFGSALILAPVLALLFGPLQAVAVCLMVGVVGTALMASGHLQDMNPKVSGTVGLAGLVFLFPGVLLLHIVDPEVMSRLIGLVTLAIALFMLLRPNAGFPPGPLPQILAGGLGGVVMGATSMGGPPVVLYLVARPDSAATKKANVVIVGGGLEIAALAVLAVFGAVDLAVFHLFLLLAPPFALGILVGRRQFHRLGTRYRPMVLVLLLCIGTVSLLS